ncbi:MAG: hypothetical protein JST16_01875 [Bdellovibrionales bacterium]|nr:hypothetical protein [Bdellovibrionales bacterium]
MSEINSIISQLERQRVAIHKALEALREVAGQGAPAPTPTRATKTASAGKRSMSEEGRRRIAEAQRRRWAAKKGLPVDQPMEEASVEAESPTEPKKRRLSEEGRARIIEAAKRRWSKQRRGAKKARTA